MANRKDNHGRVLRQGESQRKDGIYQYRYTSFGKREYVYASSLSDLREKEKEIVIAQGSGADYARGSITVGQLLTAWYNGLHGVKQKTRESYDTIVRCIKKTPFSNTPIRNVKKSTAKTFLVNMQKDGYKSSTVSHYKAVLQSAFQLAVDDDIIAKNPFAHRLNYLENDRAQKVALTEEDQDAFLTMLKDSKSEDNYYIASILLETGLRIGELCGLTISDVDFASNSLSVSKQLSVDKNGRMYISTPKTASGNRRIPLSTEAAKCLRVMIHRAKSIKTKTIVDGYSNFIFVDDNGVPVTGTIICNRFRHAIINYNKTHTDKLPMTTPHILRHTFCTNLVIRGVPPKDVQYLMGHASIQMTLNVYTNTTYDRVEESFAKYNAK